MRTFFFQDFLNMTNGKFLPSVTFESQDFGRHFLLDANMEFLSAPSFKSGGYDESQIGYVEEWTDWEGVDMAKIFGIYRTMAAQFHYDEILRLKGLGCVTIKISATFLTILLHFPL